MASSCFQAIFILITLFATNVRGHTNMTLYEKLPPLYSLHNYEGCLSGQETSPSSYCVVFAEIKPDKDSELWHNIESFSNDFYYRFRHDFLYFGLCVEECKEILKNATYDLEQMSDPETPDNQIVDFFRRVYKDDLSEERSVYYKLLHHCVNYELQRKYNLTAKTFVQYCDTTAKETQNKNGYPQTIAYALIALLIFLNIFSSIYDYYLKCKYDSLKQQSKDHYTQTTENLGTTILTSFSIIRNYRKLSADNADFQFTYFYRFYTAFIVVLGHILVLVSGTPMKNPEFFENRTYQPLTIILQNGSALIQIFFVLAGFMLKLKLDKLKMITTTTGFAKSTSVFFLAWIQRYLRILPSLAMVIFFSATLLPRWGSGPFWKHIADSESVFCTQYWWKNVFLINNYMMQDSCLHQSWYLSADMHLYALYIIVLIVTTRFKSLKKPIYILLGIISFVVPGIVTYAYRLQGNNFAHPEYYRYLYFKDNETMHRSYVPTHCNLGGYLMGIICAEIYQSQRFKQLKSNLSKYVNNHAVQIPIMVSLLLFKLALLFSGLMVIFKNNDKPSLFLAIYAAFYRNLWAILGAFCILTMSMKFSGIAYDLCCKSIFRVLGRITFQIYLWHVIVMRLLYGTSKEAMFLSDGLWFWQTIVAFGVSTAIAFIMTLCMEFPTGNILSILFKRATAPRGRTTEVRKTK